MRRTACLLPLAVVAATLPSAGLGANASVSVGNNKTLSPTAVTVGQGETVTWNWVGPDRDHVIVSNAGQAESWDSHPGVDDGDRPPGTTFTHQFNIPGGYDYHCRIHPDRMNGTVTVSGGGTPPPTASFVVSPAVRVAGSPVTFDGSASSAAAGRTITAYDWDLDGNGSFETAGGVSPTTSRTYPAPGSVTVRLRVTDSATATAQATQTITVASGAPTAAFSADPLSPLVGDVVTFDASASSVLPGRTVSAYAWDLDGDGSFETAGGTAPTIQRAYLAPGPLTVRLRLTDSAGQHAEASRALEVRASPMSPPPTPPPATPSGPPPSGPARIEVAATPVSVVLGSARLRIRTPRTTIRARCDRACALSADARLLIGGKASGAVGTRLRELGPTDHEVQLQVPAARVGAIRAALRAKRRVLVRVSVRAAGASVPPTVATVGVTT